MIFSGGLCIIDTKYIFLEAQALETQVINQPTDRAGENLPPVGQVGAGSQPIEQIGIQQSEQIGIQQSGQMNDQASDSHINDFAEYLLCLALDVGEGMLKNGGDVNRVEDTIERICRAYGAAHVEVFTIISVINAAVRMPDGSYSSQLRRVKQTSNNLGKLERLNALSRDICRDKPELSEFDRRLHELKKNPEYSRGTILAISGIAAGTFTLLFGGGIKDALVSLLIGAIISAIDMRFSKKLNIMARVLLSTFMATIMSGIAVKYFGIASSHDTIMSGVIMLLVPGMAFGTAMRDLFYGDLLAGALKTLQASLTSLMIAFGYVLAMNIFQNDISSMESGWGAWTILKDFVTAFIASVAFAIIFRVNKKHLMYAGIGSIITFAIYYVFAEPNLIFEKPNLFLAAILSAIFTAIYSEASARIHKAPTLVFLITGVIPTVPGRYLYLTMRYLVEQNWEKALFYFKDTMMIALGIAAGLVGIAIFWGMVSDVIKEYTKKLEKKN